MSTNQRNVSTLLYEFFKISLVFNMNFCYFCVCEFRASVVNIFSNDSRSSKRTTTLTLTCMVGVVVIYSDSADYQGLGKEPTRRDVFHYLR